MAIYIDEADATEQGAWWLQHIIFAQQGEEASAKFGTQFKAIYVDLAGTRQFCWWPVFELFLDYSSDLFSAIPEGRQEEKAKEVESFFALVLSDLTMLEEAEQLDKGTTRLCQIFTADAVQQPDLRLRLLMNLYNVFEPSLEFRYRVFKYIIDYAHEASLFDQVAPYLEHLDMWMVDWELHITSDDKRALFRDLSKYVRGLGKRVDSFLYLKRYHGLFQGATEAEVADKSVRACTVQLLTDAVSIPSVIQFDDILALDTVKALNKSKDANESGLVMLGEVFLSGTVNTMRDFHKKHEALFKTHELSIEESMSKIRLLTLATLARYKSEMTLAEVAEGLQESEEGVERWVVRAISEGVIDGRIDQLNSKVIIKSAFQRKFEKDEWKFLEDKLGCWIDNLESVIDFIGRQKTLGAGGGAAEEMAEEAAKN